MSKVNLPHDRIEPEDAAYYIGVKESTLAAWRSSKRYDLPFIKVGRLIRYRKTDLDKWLQSRTQNSPEAA